VFPYARLAVWSKAHAVTLDVYRLTRTFPRDEAFGLTAQMRRAAVSIPANIVEGSKRRSSRDFAHFLNISEGSAAELSYLLSVAAALAYGDDAEISRLVGELDHIQRMIYALRSRVAQQAGART